MKYNGGRVETHIVLNRKQIEEALICNFQDVLNLGDDPRVRIDIIKEDDKPDDVKATIIYMQQVKG